MVNAETLQVIINAKDMLTSKVRQANEAIRQTGTIANTSGIVASNATNKIGSAYERLRSKVTNVFNNIKQVIKNSSVGTAVNESGLARPFLNAAEKIKQKWTSMVETIKSKLKGLNNNANVGGGFNISAAGLATLNGQITTTTGKVSTLGNMINKIGGYSSTLGIKLSTAFATAQTKIETFKSKLTSVGSKMQSVVGGLSGVQSAIMSAFGAVGVTSLSQFTIGAAVARQKLNAVTTSITGSEAATKSLNNAISAATSGGIVGFTKVAQAVQQIGIKYNLTNKQLEATAPVLNKIGTLARAMGKDASTAQTIMSKAYDGLNGNFMLLQRNLGITKQQLLDAGWTGAASDVDGYTLALSKVLDQKPEMQEYLNSYEGQMERLKLAIGGVGRQIGEVFLPILNALLGGFLDLHQKCPWLTTAIVALGVAILGIVSILSVLAPIIIMITELEISLNLAVLANPWVILAVAIIAIIAVMWHLYNTNENVRNALNNLGKTIRGILVKAWENLQKIVQPIIPTFQHLWDVIGRMCNQLLSFFGITSQTGDSFDTWTAIAKLLGAILEVIVKHMVTMAEVALSILVPALNFIVNVISSLLNFLTSVGEALSLLMEGDVIGFLETITDALDTLLINIVVSLGEMLLEILNNMGLIFGVATGMIWNWIVSLVTNFVNGAILAVTGFISWISTLPGQLWAWLWNAILKVNNWRQQTVNNFIKAATDAVNGFINWVSGLPGKFWNWLVNTYNKVSAFKDTLVQKIKDAAKSMVDGFIDWVKKLPSKFGEWLGKIKNEITSRKGALVRAITQLGRNLLNSFKDALLGGLGGSSAYISNAIDEQVFSVKSAYLNNIDGVVMAASKVGESAVKAFNDTGANVLTSAVNSNKDTISYKVSSKLQDETKIRNDEKNILNDILELLESMNLNEALQKTQNTTNNNKSNEPIIVDNTGTVEVKYDLNINGLPTGVDEATVAQIVIDTVTSKDVIKQIVTSPTFQRFDEKTKARLLNELRRHI